MGMSPEIRPDAELWFQSIIDMFRWMVELGRMNIITKPLLLASHLVSPSDGQLEAAVPNFAFVGQKY